ncbi:hypothetical protein KA001_02620 [Patescibacteria group bacterium]|nr:hypothetical protein [Patescibacteria group bacterium]
MKIDLPIVLATVNIFFGIFLCFLVVVLSKREQHLKTKFSKSEQNSREILEKAHIAAVTVLENSEKLISTIDATYKKASEDLLVELQKNNQEIYKNLFEKIVIANTDFYKKALTDLNALSTKKIEENSKFFKEQFEEFDEFIKLQKIESIKDIENYKKAKIEAFDKDFSKIIKEVVSKVLPQTITAQQNEKLIYSAVEEAKKNGFFNNI